MKRHVRKQGPRFSFRLRLFNGYVEAHDIYDTEEDAAFAADVAKHYLRTLFHISKNTEASLDGEVFSMLCHRHNVDLSDRLSVLSLLAPGIKEYISNHHAELERHAESNRPEKKPWEVLRASPLFNSSFSVQSWVLACEAAEQDAKDLAEIDARSNVTRFEVARGAMETAARSLRVTQRMHAGVTNPRLVKRARIITELIDHIEATEAHVRFLADQFKEEDERVVNAIAVLSASRPALT